MAVPRFAHLVTHWRARRLCPPLAIVSSAPVNIRVQSFVCACAYSDFERKPGAEWFGRVVMCASPFWGTAPPGFTAATFYIPPDNEWGDDLSSPSRPLHVSFVIRAIQTGDPSIAIFLCISLMTSHVEHLFACLLAIRISSVEHCLFKSLTIFSWIFCVFALLQELFIYSGY